jgi:hypothetical protein
MTGSQGFLLGQYIADRVPASGSRHDIEFEDWPINPAWLITGSAFPLAPYDVDNSWPSHLHASLSGTQDLMAVLNQNYFAPASGSVSVTVCAIVSLSNTSADGVSIAARTANTSGAGQESMGALYLRAGSDNPELRMDKIVGGASTFNLGLRNINFRTRVYLHLERVGTGSWGAAASSDGLGWIPISALQSQYFSSLPIIQARLFKVGNIFAREPFGFDWIRINHLFLFS